MWLMQYYNNQTKYKVAIYWLPHYDLQYEAHHGLLLLFIVYSLMWHFQKVSYRCISSRSGFTVDDM